MTAGAGPAIIIAGGRARRLGCVDKPMVRVAGRRLIEHALDAAAARRPVVLVGGPFEIDDERVIWTREEPPFGGPAAALIAGLNALDSDVTAEEVLVLAADLPDAVRLVRLLDAEPFPADLDGIVAADDTGRAQWLAGRYRLAALRRAARAAGNADGLSMREVLSHVKLQTLPVGDAAADLDTWEAIEEYRRAHPTNAEPTTDQKDDTMTDSPSELETWVLKAAAELGVDPGEVPTGLLLDVTREIAHEVVRPAGPVTTFLIGLAVGRGSTVDDAVVAVRALIADRGGAD